MTALNLPPILEGHWLTDPDGWRVDIGEQSWTHEDETHPFGDITLELDGIGCLASAMLTLTRPLGLKPFGATVKLWAHDRQKGWVPLAEGFVKGPLDRRAALSELTLEPLENLVMGDYYGGKVPPSIPGLSISTHNAAGVVARPPEDAWTARNDQVIGDALRADALATIGVDAYRRVIVARPTQGSPVLLSAADVYDLQPSTYEYPPYGTVTRTDPGKGWRKVEHRLDRGQLVPVVVVDSEPAEFREVVRGYGPPLVQARQVLLKEGEVTASGLEWHGEEMTLEVTAEACAYVMTYDFQEWYRNSALVEQNQEQLDTARKELDTARLLLAQRVAWYGDGHQYVAEAQQATHTAQATLAAVQAGAVRGDSDYEPLTALLTLGLQPLTLQAARLALDWVMWISKVPWDEAAAGESDDPDLEYSLLHPKDQPNTIKVLLSTSDDFDVGDLNRPLQPADLSIPEELFRQNMGSRLAATLDKLWRDSFEPDEPSPDTEPPPWDGRWYLHVGAGWHAVPGSRTLADWREARDLPREQLGAVTMGPMIRTRGTGSEGV